MERKIPKNVRQIGNVSDTPKIYVEDYVDTYLNQLCEQGLEEPVGAFLIGEVVKNEEQDSVYIYGALKMSEIGKVGPDLVIEDSVWQESYTTCKEYFDDGEIVGWFVTVPGLPLGINSNLRKIHQKAFPKENSLLIIKDALEKEDLFFVHKYNDMMQMGGHYIYYERNPSMQNYMISTRKKIGVTPSEVFADRAAKDFRSVIRERMEQGGQKQNNRYAYMISTFLVLVVLVIGVTMINNYDKMQSVQSSLEALSKSVSGEKAAEEKATGKEVEVAGEKAENTTPDEQKPADDGSGELKETTGELKGDYYVVEKGDTLASISVKSYGDMRHVDAICRMNGLTDGNLIYIGQKLLLP